MPDAVTDALLIVFAAFVYIEGGRAHWRLLVQHDMLVHPDLADCEFRAGLEAGHIGARFTRWAFIALWPFWLALGWLNGLLPVSWTPRLGVS
jgi:hypothetical protein